MRRLDPNQIREEFNQQKQRFSAAHDKSGLNQALEAISQVVGDLKASGMDVGLEIFGSPSEQAFDLFPRPGGLTVPVSGAIRIGTHQRLLAIATKMGDANVLKLSLSEFDIRFQGPEATLSVPHVSADSAPQSVNVFGKIRATVYDLRNDPDALVKFETEIIRHVARNAVVHDHDVAAAFDNADTLGKSGLKIIPKP